MGIADQETILTGKKLKIVKITGQGINAYIVINKDIQFESYTTQKDALLNYNELEIIGEKL